MSSNGNKKNGVNTNIQWRRCKVLELSSQGCNQREIASILHVTQPTVNKDLSHIRQEAQDNLQNHIQETITSEYWRAMTSMNSILKMAWAIVSRTQDDKTKLQGLALIKDCTNSRVDMSASAPALKYITEQKERLIALEKLDKQLEEEEQATTSGIY